MTAISAAAFHRRVFAATAAAGFEATTVVREIFEKGDVLNQSLIPESAEDDHRAKVWLSQQKPDGPSNLYVQNNVWRPGGSTGWHTHPGRNLIIVTAGVVTDYEKVGGECRPHVYNKRMAFEDPHILSVCCHRAAENLEVQP